MICWSDGPKAEFDALTGYDHVFDWVRLLDRLAGAGALFGRLLRLSTIPSLAGAMHTDRASMDQLVSDVRDFAPQLVIAENVHAALFATKIARRLNLPLVVRSHNIEHDYMATQFRLAASWRTRLSIGAALLHLKSYEIDALRQADFVLEISREGVAFWRALGVENVEWVPTLVPMLERGLPDPLPWTERRYDAVYLGNLWSPNNVAAVRWLVTEVMPHVRRAAPHFVLLIAGSKPSAALQGELTGVANIELLADPEDAAVVRRNGRVLVNPILEGSGLNTKSVEMLFFDSPLVMTPFAADGMDAETRTCFELEADPGAFAAAMVRAAGTVFQLEESRHQARERFGQAGTARLSAILAEVVNRGPGRGAAGRA